LIELKNRYEQVLARIASACLASGREMDSVELIAITKNHPVELVRELYDLGHRVFGENRDQEASKKSQGLNDLIPQNQASWHFVGQLQSNKVRSVLGYTSTIHSIDRPSLVGELAKQLPKFDRQFSGFIELNLTDDPGRGGVGPADLLALADKVAQLPNFRLLGVMAVAGLGVDPKVDFERAKSASEELQQHLPQAKYLSMGMSEDFEIAISMGATHIRVGSAITGPRAYSA
jgi:pyridoxal phosphate enzyme (YggS family)